MSINQWIRDWLDRPPDPNVCHKAVGPYHRDPEASIAYRCNDWARGFRDFVLNEFDSICHNNSDLRPLGNDVRLVQDLLWRWGYYRPKCPKTCCSPPCSATPCSYRQAADGRYDGPTRAAVALFQQHHHLEPDGVVGPHTWAALQFGDAILFYRQDPNDPNSITTCSEEDHIGPALQTQCTTRSYGHECHPSEHVASIRRGNETLSSENRGYWYFKWADTTLRPRVISKLEDAGDLPC